MGSRTAGSAITQICKRIFLVFSLALSSASALALDLQVAVNPNPPTPGEQLDIAIVVTNDTAVPVVQSLLI